MSFSASQGNTLLMTAAIAASNCASASVVVLFMSSFLLTAFSYLSEDDVIVEQCSAHENEKSQHRPDVVNGIKNGCPTKYAHDDDPLRQTPHLTVGSSLRGLRPATRRPSRRRRSWSV